MWIIRSIILLVGVAALVWLSALNAGTKVIFHLFTRTYTTELNLIIVVTFISVMLIWAIGAWIREAQLRLHILKSRRNNRKLREELSDLRNLPLEDEQEAEIIE